MKHFFLALAAAALVSSTAIAQAPKQSTADDGSAASIAWYGTWQAGQKAARESGKPILLVSAAPHCHNVSGIW